MSRVFFASELETVATFWRVLRRDGVALGFSSHNRDMIFDGLLYRSAPGMVPSAIRRNADLAADAVEVQGMLAHDAISEDDMRTGRYDGARIAIGLVDWETRERATLFLGELGNIREQSGKFEAELQSAKASLELDAVPRTSPTCRAVFCDTGCRLNTVNFTHLATVQSVDDATSKVIFSDGPVASQMLHGDVRWLDGPNAGLIMRVIDADINGLTLDSPLDHLPSAGERAFLREGCDHTIATCDSRFNNALNFRGEPFLPGNDLLTRYPTSFT